MQTNSKGHPILTGFLKIAFIAAGGERVTRIIRHDGTPPPVKKTGPFAGTRLLSTQSVWPEPRGANIEMILTDWDRLLWAQPVVRNLHYDNWEHAEDLSIPRPSDER